jgi:hypothetical protein
MPILKSRAPDASAKEIEVGEARTEQVADYFTISEND